MASPSLSWSVLLIGCSQPCTPGAVVGKYTMSTNLHTYKLTLAAGGLGALSRDGSAESIKWEWENEQVFLDLGGVLAADLMALSSPSTHRDPFLKSNAIYLGLIPECQAGKTAKLALTLEDETVPRFTRN